MRGNAVSRQQPLLDLSVIQELSVLVDFEIELVEIRDRAIAIGDGYVDGDVARLLCGGRHSLDAHAAAERTSTDEPANG